MYPLADQPLGFDTGDPVLNEASIARTWTRGCACGCLGAWVLVGMWACGHVAVCWSTCMCCSAHLRAWRVLNRTASISPPAISSLSVLTGNVHVRVLHAASQAAKVLRLLHINELRDAQTQINELVVNVQALTADPKTNAKLGKVGR